LFDDLYVHYLSKYISIEDFCSPSDGLGRTDRDLSRMITVSCVFDDDSKRNAAMIMLSEIRAVTSCAQARNYRPPVFQID